MKSHIFRQYDIRGIVGEDLDPEVTEAVGRALGHVCDVMLIRRRLLSRWGVTIALHHRP